MPAKSAARQKTAGAALGAKCGYTPKFAPKGALKQMVGSITEKQLEEFACNRRHGEPEHVKS